VSALDRVMARVDQTGDCWIWTGPLRRDGAGQIEINGRKHLAYRLTYELLVGPIPEGLVLDHLCRNRACVRPEHLEPVTFNENVRRGRAVQAASEAWARRWAERSQCSRGHLLADTTIVIRQRDGYISRNCAECIREQRARAYQREKADPDRIARRRDRNRVAAAEYKARKRAAQ
jgi:hypothetical protein